MKAINIFGLFLLIIGVVGWFSSIYFLAVSNNEFVIEEVPCYDRNRNEIQDLTCEEKTFPYNDRLMALMMFSILLSAVGLVFLNLQRKEYAI